MLLNLPQDAWQCIAIHLSPPDILSFLSVHPNINNHLANSVSFWKQLLAIHRDDIQYNNDTTIANNNSISSNSSSISNVKDARHEFMLQAYKSSLPSVKWLPLDIDRTFPVSAREGHISCVLHGPDNWKNLVITGGFSDDDGVMLVHLPRGIKSHTETWGWTRLQPQHRTTFAYGATLTALPPVDSGRNENVTIAKAVRFGGFESGGYSDETNDVWMLTIRDEEYEDGSLSQTANWEKVETTGVAPRPRAYHSATLIHERYLVIIGGMTLHGSCIDEAILDTITWKWIDVSMARIGEQPSGRHGHSVNWDERRDRLVLFGGGSGTDLLRSGVDNSEVWELKMNGVEVPSFDDEDETSWIWSMVHGDSEASDDEDDSSNDEEYEEENTNQDYIDGEDNLMKEVNRTSDKATAMNNHLSPTESLCLGRCHNSMKIAPDTVLLMFGGGQTNTNGVIGYDLRTDSFIRPKVTGPLPLPRWYPHRLPSHMRPLYSILLSDSGII